jgi:hypothetical protein
MSLYDTNGRTEDVYEWEPDGLGSCGQTAGCVFMISSGTSTSPSNFLGADPSGENAFFTTRERLVGEDTDDLLDVYDARVNGGFATLTPPQCSGTGCQGVPGAPPIFATPSSVTFNGVGNYNAEPASAPAKTKSKAKPKKKIRCAKPKKRKHVRCARAQRSARVGARRGGAR